MLLIRLTSCYHLAHISHNPDIHTMIKYHEHSSTCCISLLKEKSYTQNYTSSLKEKIISFLSIAYQNFVHIIYLQDIFWLAYMYNLKDQIQLKKNNKDSGDK